MALLAASFAIAWGAVTAWLFLRSVAHAARGRGPHMLLRSPLVAALLFAPWLLSGALGLASVAGFVVAKNVLLRREVLGAR